MPGWFWALIYRHSGDFANFLPARPQSARLREGVKTQCGSVANVPSVVNTHQQGLATGGRQEYTLELGELVSVMSVLMHISLSRDTESPIGTSADTEEIF